MGLIIKNVVPTFMKDGDILFLSCWILWNEFQIMVFIIEYMGSQYWLYFYSVSPVLNASGKKSDYQKKSWR